jgi:hypothetical protein
MDKFLDKLCDLIVKCARGINAVLPIMLGIIAAYFLVLLGYAIFNVF